MITRQSWTTLVLGALAGAGLGAGALTVVKRSSGRCCGGGQPCAPTVPADVITGPAIADGGSTVALTSLARSGPADGRWSYQDSRRTSNQVLSRDPSDAGVLHLRPVGDKNARTKTMPVDVIARVFFGNVQRFLANYRPCEAATPDAVVSAELAASQGAAGRDVLRVRWCSVSGDTGPFRHVWMDALTHEIARLEDRTRDGHLIRQLNFTRLSPDEFVPPVPGSAEKAKASLPALSSRTMANFDEFVSRVEIPIYEPAELPPRYARTEFGFDNRPYGSAGTPLRVAWIGYDEGVMQMNLFIAPPEDMVRLEAISRTAALNKGGAHGGGASGTDAPVPGGCASMPIDTPEEIFESEGAVTVRVRSDGCRIVVRRDDLPGVAIALVGSAATPRDAYIRTIRNLVLVRARTK